MKCGNFQSREAVMSDIAGRLSRSKGEGEKTRLARRLRQETDMLLACADHVPGSQDCENCRAIAARHRRITEWTLKKKAAWTGGV